MIFFIHGKGGVGRSTVAEALAWRLAEQGSSVHWYLLHEHRAPDSISEALTPRFTRTQLSAQVAFQEYMTLLLHNAWAGKIFAQNRLIQYLSEAAPGIHEIVLLGKIWHDRKQTDHQIVDLPSTGYARSMFQSIRNFALLFEGGAVYRDTQEMLKTFSSPKEAEHWIVATPEELPMTEAYEHALGIAHTLPNLKLKWLLNRCLPVPEHFQMVEHTPLLIPVSQSEALTERLYREIQARELWRTHSIQWKEWPWLPGPHASRVQKLSERNLL